MAPNIFGSGEGLKGIACVGYPNDPRGLALIGTKYFCVSLMGIYTEIFIFGYWVTGSARESLHPEISLLLLVGPQYLSRNW